VTEGSAGAGGVILRCRAGRHIGRMDDFTGAGEVARIADAGRAIARLADMPRPEARSLGSGRERCAVDQGVF
jgi:hypothetical protein